MRNQKRIILMGGALVVALTVGSLLGQPVFAGDEEEEFFIQRAQNRYFDLPQSARHIGMGGSSAPTTRDVSALFTNPAGLGWLYQVELSLNYRYEQISGDEFPLPPGSPDFDSVDEDIHNGYFIGAVPLEAGYYGVLGLGLSLYDSDVDDSIDTDTDGFRLHLGYGYMVDDMWSIGYALTYLNDNEDSDWVDYEMDNAWRNEVGIQVRPDDLWTIGLTGFYAFGDAKSDIRLAGDQDGDRDSWGLSAGVSWQAWEKTLLAAAIDYTDYNLDADVTNTALGLDENVDEDGESWGIHLGVEHAFCDWFTGRLGYRFRSNEFDFEDAGAATKLSGDADFSAASAGFQLMANEVSSIDYGVEYRWVGDGDFTHSIGVSFRF